MAKRFDANDLHDLLNSYGYLKSAINCRVHNDDDLRRAYEELLDLVSSLKSSNCIPPDMVRIPADNPADNLKLDDLAKVLSEAGFAHTFSIPSIESPVIAQLVLTIHDGLRVSIPKASPWTFRIIYNKNPKPSNTPKIYKSPTQIFGETFFEYGVIFGFKSERDQLLAKMFL